MDAPSSFGRSRGTASRKMEDARMRPLLALLGFGLLSAFVARGAGDENYRAGVKLLKDGNATAAQCRP